jgi:hypothetical protein
VTEVYNAEEQSSRKTGACSALQLINDDTKPSFKLEARWRSLLEWLKVREESWARKEAFRNVLNIGYSGFENT